MEVTVRQLPASGGRVVQASVPAGADPPLGVRAIVGCRRTGRRATGRVVSVETRRRVLLDGQGGTGQSTSRVCGILLDREAPS